VQCGTSTTGCWTASADRWRRLGEPDALLARGAAKVYAGARRLENLAELVASSRGRVVPVQLDVTHPDEVRAAAALASDVTLLVNNAGVVAKFGVAFTDESWLDAARTEYEVNVLGPFAITQTFAPILAKNGGGTVANVSSVAGLVAFDILPSYSASKAALHAVASSAEPRAGGGGVSSGRRCPCPPPSRRRVRCTVSASSSWARYWPARSAARSSPGSAPR